MSADEMLREAIERLAEEHEQVMDSLVPMPNREERESGRRLVRRLRALLAEHPASSADNLDSTTSRSVEERAAATPAEEPAHRDTAYYREEDREDS